jgi:hypothetical protein
VTVVVAVDKSTMNCATMRCMRQIAIHEFTRYIEAGLKFELAFDFQ